MSDAVARLNAALEGRYRIERELGEGGMATVYLADDLKHERKVALKVLKPELAAVVGAERFLSEIKTTANLQHPHILPLFDSGEADGFDPEPLVTQSLLLIWNGLRSGDAMVGKINPECARTPSPVLRSRIQPHPSPANPDVSANRRAWSC